jgi:predicted MFS family arabinose efflux permease
MYFLLFLVFFIYGKELDETIQCPNLFPYSFMLSAWSLLLAAIQLPMQDSSRDSSSQMDISKLLANQSFVSSILASVCFFNLQIIIFIFIEQQNGKISQFGDT